LPFHWRCDSWNLHTIYILAYKTSHPIFLPAMPPYESTLSCIDRAMSNAEEEHSWQHGVVGSAIDLTYPDWEKERAPEKEEGVLQRRRSTLMSRRRRSCWVPTQQMSWTKCRRSTWRSMWWWRNPSCWRKKTKLFSSFRRRACDAASCLLYHFLHVVIISNRKEKRLVERSHRLHHNTMSQSSNSCQCVPILLLTRFHKTHWSSESVTNLWSLPEKQKKLEHFALSRGNKNEIRAPFISQKIFTDPRTRRSALNKWTKRAEIKRHQNRAWI
jgi:hypothetical protein